MKNGKYTMDKTKRKSIRLLLRRRRIQEGRCEETQVLERKRIQKDKILNIEEEEGKEQEEEDEYKQGVDKEKDRQYEEKEQRRRRILRLFKKENILTLSD